MSNLQALAGLGGQVRPTQNQNQNLGGGSNIEALMGGGGGNEPREPQYDQQPDQPRELPPGAIDFLPNGEAYYGEGFEGWLRGAKARMSEQSYQKQADGSYAPVQTSALQMGARGIKEGVGGLLSGMTYVQEQAQRATSLGRTLDDIADQSQSFLPDLNKNRQASTALEALPGYTAVQAAYNTARILTGSRKMAWEDVTKTAEENAVLASGLAGTSMYDASVREEFIRRSRAGEKADYLVAELANPFAEMAYDFVVDPFNIVGAFVDDAVKAAKLLTNARRYETLDELKDGWTALRAATTYGDEAPVVADMAAKLAARNAQYAGELQKAGSALNPFNPVGDVVAGLNPFKPGRQGATQGIFNETALLSPARLSSRGRADQAADTLDIMFKSLAGVFKSTPDDFGEVLRAAALVGATDAGKIEEGLQILNRTSNTMGQLLTSPEGLHAARFMNKMLIDDAGKVTGKLMGEVVDALKNGQGIPEVVAKWEKASNKVYAELFPSVLEMVAKDKKLIEAGKEAMYNVPKWAENIAKAHQKTQDGWNMLGVKLPGVRGINGLLSSVYITTNPGAGFRNLLNNIVTAAVDYGPEAGATAAAGFGRRVAGQVDPGVAKISNLLGLDGKTTLRAAERGLTGGAAGPVEDGKNLVKFIGGLTEKGEQATSTALVYSSLKRTLGKAAREGVMIADATPLRQLGVPEDQVKYLIGLVEKNGYDVEKALSAWMGEASTGVIDTFRDIRSVMHPLDIEDARAIPNLLEEAENILSAATKDEALAGVAALRQKWAKQAAKAVDGLIPGIEDGSEVGNGILEAVQSGMDEMVGDAFNVKLRAQQTATRALNDAADKIVRNAIIENSGDKLTVTALTELQAEMGKIKKQIFEATKHQPLLDTVRGIVHGGRDDTQKMINAQKLFPGTKNLPSFEKWVTENPARGSNAVDTIWQYYFDARKSLHDAELTNYAEAWSKLLTERLNPIIGRDALQDDLFKIAWETSEDAKVIMAADVITKDGIYTDMVKFWLEQGKPKTAIRALAQRNGIASATEAGVGYDEYILRAINKNLPEEAEAFRSLDDMPFETAQAALAQRAAAKAGPSALLEKVPGAVPDTKGLEKVAPLLEDGMLPSSGQAAKANQKGVNLWLDRLEASIQTSWGKGSAAGTITPEQMQALNAWKAETLGRTAQTRAVAARVAQQERDFALLNYSQKTTLDHALAYIMPYQFWYNRSYQNWMGRLATHPDIISKYANYRQWLEQEHANLPEWWRYNVSLNDLPGVNVQNPMYMNLEATLNPLNGLTGIDFNDTNKIVGEKGTFENFWTSTLNDIGKFGPSVWSPLTMATAGYLYAKGEQDAAQRWGGRLIPQTAFIKAAAAKFGNANVELDPLVQLFSGGSGSDAYETRRIGRALYALGETGDAQGKISKEEAIEAARLRQGPIWERARLLASQDRAGGQIAASLFGVGFKQRSESDMQVDEFYEANAALWKQRNMLAPDEFRVQMDLLREKYPFMDAVLLSKQGGPDRDRAYAYTVMGRVAPGQMTAILKSQGVSPELSELFYASKGDMSKWAEDDRLKFMGAMVGMGTTLAIPPATTQREWTAARNAYAAVQKQMKDQLGQDIFDKIDAWYDLENPRQKEIYLAQHPEVQQAMDYKAFQVANQPILAAYYNGMANIEDYWKGEMRKDVKLKLGADYYELLREREGLFTKQELAAFDRQHPQLKKYTPLAKKWNEFIQRQMLDYAGKLPEGQSSFVQEIDLTSTGQKALVEALAPETQTQWEEIAPTVPETLKQAIYRYFVDGRPLSSAEKTVLNRTANYLNISADELLLSAQRVLPVETP